MNALRKTAIGTTPLSGVRYLRGATVLLVFLFLTVGFVIGLMRIATEHRDAVSNGRRMVQSTLQLVQTRADMLICEAMMIVGGMGDIYRNQKLAGAVDITYLNHVMARRMGHMPHVTTYMLVDMDRNIITGMSQPAVVESGTSRDTSKFDLPRDNALSFVGPPVSGWDPAAPERWFLPAGVRIGPAEDAIGYAVTMIDIAYFTTLYSDIDLGENGRVSLWTADGRLVSASTPELGTVGSHNAAIQRAFAETVPTHPTQLQISGPTDTEPAEINGRAKLERLPLMIAVDMSSTDYLRAWRGTRNRMMTSAVGVLLATLAFAGIILSQLQRARENEEALRNAKAVAEEANEAKSRFLAHMSHEFRTPLNAIMGFSDIIRTKAMGEPLAEVYVTYAGHIYRSGEHLLEIVNDVLDMAKIESGVQTLQPAPMTVNNAIDSAVSFLGEMARASDLRVKMVVVPHLPPIMSDERFVRQVLINLISNAIKFSPPHGEVVVRGVLTDDDHIDVSVIDHGPGIEPIILKRIGEPFLQGNPALSRAGQGTGLGLSICKHYMELMGGTLLVESILGTGTTVTMRFPKDLRCQNADLEKSTA